MTIPPLLRPSYWFGIKPVPLTTRVLWVLLILFAAFVVGGVVARFVAKRKGMDKLIKKVFLTVSAYAFWLGVFGLYLSAVNFERIQMLSSRFWFLIWAAILGYGLYRVWKMIWKEIPAERAKQEEREKYNKWLPRPNV